MKFYFFDKDDNFLFSRSDAEDFVQLCRDFACEGTFPSDPVHEIAAGMRIAWKDDDDAWEVYELDNVGPSVFGGVSVSGVHLALAELRDDIVRTITLDNTPLSEALDQILEGQSWSRGTIRGDTGEASQVDQYKVTGSSVNLRSGPGTKYKAIAVQHRNDLMTLIEKTTSYWYKVESPDGRSGWMSAQYLEYSGTGTGSASIPVSLAESTRLTPWELLETVAAYAELLLWPRVEIPEDGSEWVRAIDLHTLAPEFRGVRLTCNTNVREANVHYDTSAQYTALIGIGAQDANFENVVWTTAGGNPVDKPKGQDYVADPNALTLYGRKGRHRLGLVNFDHISDPAELLQKTWERLQQVQLPQVTIDGESADLYKLGYGGQSMRLYDAVHIILRPINVRMTAHILDLRRNLVHPEHTQPVIGTSMGDDIISSLQAVSGGLSSLSGSMIASGASVGTRIAALEARVKALEDKEA